MTVAAPARGTEGAPGATELRGLARRLTPVDVTVDLARLSPRERAAAGALIEAAQVMDALFLRQVSARNGSLLLQLAADPTARGKERLHAFFQNKGPWLRLDGERPFLAGIGPKSPAANFYPADATKSEVESWMRGLPAPARAAAEGFFTVIRRGPDRKLTAIPYSVEYQGELARVAALLNEAADLTEQPTLHAFLQRRASAFLSNDYADSDIAWMKLDSVLEPTIGPYEVYEDGWFSAKAAFEAFITVRDDDATGRLTQFAAELQDIEDHLPIEPGLRNPQLGSLAPIRVVSALFSSGDGNRGVQTAAFNLPNDEHTARIMGTKRTMLRNIQQAKFDKVLVPIARLALSAADRRKVDFDAFFAHILMHELAHGLGPHAVRPSPPPTPPPGSESPRPPAPPTVTVRAALQESYSAIEEAKADMAGLFALQFLIDKGVIDRALERTMYSTFVASAFRSVRFGLTEAHGRGMALQLTTLLSAGAIGVTADGTFAVDSTKMKSAVRDLTRELMLLQASGDKDRAAALLRDRAVIRPEVAAVLARLSQVPVDIEPRFVTAEALLAERRARPGTPTASPAASPPLPASSTGSRPMPARP